MPAETKDFGVAELKYHIIMVVTIALESQMRKRHEEVAGGGR
jgi:hypothetical protein